MSIQPIDLQVLFARLNQIGREQVAQRNLLIQAQAVTANEIAERSEAQDRRVSDVSTEEEGPEKVADEGEGSHASQEQKEEEQSAGDTPAREVFSDPDLGQNIDISG